MSVNTNVLVCGRGYWGRGITFVDAVRNAQWLRKGDKVFIAPCPEGTRVDDMGRIYTPAGTSLGPIQHGVISGSAKAPMFKPNPVQPD
jgi:hypothetical protein